MTKALITQSHLDAIGNAIRAKNGTENVYKPGEMAAAILALPTGTTPTGTINITQNGTVDVTDYASANVNVANSYAAGDEGKIVSNGALVAQTARSSQITENGTYDTTNNNSVTVNVSGGGSQVLIGTDVPSSSIGTDGQFYIRAYNITTISYGIRISVAARDNNYGFIYWGARDIDFVFTDGSDDYHLRDFTGATAEWAASDSGAYNTQNNVIDGNTNSYYEHSSLPGWYRISAQIPSGMALKKVRICGRNDSWKDFWSSFTIGQLSADHAFYDTLISESSLSLSDWDTSSQSAYTEFALTTPTEPQKTEYELYLKQSGAWSLVAQ